MEATRATTVQETAFAGARQVVADYVTLTKPKVQSLLLFTTVCAMFIAGTPSAALVLATVIGGYLSAGGSGAINHWYDRDIDTRMGRTGQPARGLGTSLPACGADLRPRPRREQGRPVAGRKGELRTSRLHVTVNAHNHMEAS